MIVILKGSDDTNDGSTESDSRLASETMNKNMLNAEEPHPIAATDMKDRFLSKYGIVLLCMAKLLFGCIV